MLELVALFAPKLNMGAGSEVTWTEFDELALPLKKSNLGVEGFGKQSVFGSSAVVPLLPELKRKAGRGDDVVELDLPMGSWFVSAPDVAGSVLK